jgi:hypothetical protein
MDIVTDDALSMVGSNNGMISLLYKHMRKLRLQNELIKYHCIINQQNLTERALRFQQIMTDVINAVNFFKSLGLNHKHNAFLGEIKSEYESLLA